MTKARSRSVSILYFSGTGGTKIVAELLGDLLAEKLECRVASIEEDASSQIAAKADLVVLLYPTYYLKPAPTMREFAEGLPNSSAPRPVYVVTTYELYAENSIRRLSLILREKGFFVVGSAAIRAPGSDVTLALPSGLIPWWYRFEKRLPEKMRAIADEILGLARVTEIRVAIPPAKWYTPFSQALQLLLFNHFDLFRRHVRVIVDRCSACGSCVAMCHRGAWTMGDATPIHHPDRCELCGRCMHRCLNHAIVLLGVFRDNRRIDEALCARLLVDARSAIKEARHE